MHSENKKQKTGWRWTQSPANSSPRISCMCLSFDREREMEGCARPLIGSGPHPPSVSFHNRAGNSQTHSRSLSCVKNNPSLARFRRMERIEDLSSTFLRQSDAGVADRDDYLTLR